MMIDKTALFELINNAFPDEKVVSEMAPNVSEEVKEEVKIVEEPSDSVKVETPATLEAKEESTDEEVQSEEVPEDFQKIIQEPEISNKLQDLINKIRSMR